MKKLITILLSMLLIISISACGQTPESNVNEGGEETANAGVDTVVPLELTVERVTDEEYDENTLVYTVIQDLIKIGNQDAAAYPEFAAELEAVVKADSDTIAHSKEKMMEEYLAMEGTYSGFADEWTSEIIRADSRLVSIRQDQYTYSGGAHPMYGSLGVNIDTASGKHLILSDVVTDVEKTKALIESCLMEDYEEVFYDSEEGILEELELESFNWTIDYESIKFYFNPYMLAPYAAGMQEVTLYFVEYPELFNEKYTEAPGPDAGTEYYGADTVSHDLYGSLIKRIYGIITDKKTMSGSLEGTFSLYDGLGHMSVSEMLSAAGYVVKDINGDGTPELMLGMVSGFDGDKAEGNLIYTLYTYADGRPVCVFESFARSSYKWAGDGKFCYIGSGGAANSGFGTFSLPAGGTELECEDFWFSDIKPGTEDEIAYYYNPDADWNADDSEELDISEDEFWALEGELLETAENIELTQFINYEKAKLIDAADLWIETSNGSELLAAAYLGYQEGGIKEFKKYAEEKGIEERYPFITQIPEKNTVLHEGGEWFVVIPDEDVKFWVNEGILDEAQGAVIPGEEQFTDEISGEAVLIRCNVSEIYPNIIIGACRDGGSPFDYSPQISGKDGSLVRDYAVFDFTPYELLPHYMFEVITDPWNPEYRYYENLGEIISTPVVGNEDPYPVLIKALKDDLTIKVEMTENYELLAERSLMKGDILFVKTELTDDDSALCVTARSQSGQNEASWYAVTDNGNEYYREIVCG